ncbi:hypothetical protein LQZ19_07950 [Treponema primitia]|uniref:hypothetical protein n=1 Tax=Treponema primitia TaxID=88058 RepID=UPI0039817E1F
MNIEEIIINAVNTLLTGRVNELLEDAEWDIPTGRPYGVTPVLTLSGGERSEKDRIITVDAFTLTIGFTIPEKDGEAHCYAYAAVIEKALVENPTLGGTVDRAVLVKKHYIPPKTPHCGDAWETLLTLRITTEGRSV